MEKKEGCFGKYERQGAQILLRSTFFNEMSDRPFLTFLGRIIRDQVANLEVFILFFFFFLAFCSPRSSFPSLVVVGVSGFAGGSPLSSQSRPSEKMFFSFSFSFLASVKSSIICEILRFAFAIMSSCKLRSSLILFLKYTLASSMKWLNLFL